MEYKIEKHWGNNKYFVIVNDRVAIGNGEIRNFKIEEIDYVNKHDIYFINNTDVFYFKNKEHAEKFLDEYLMPHIVMEKLTR